MFTFASRNVPSKLCDSIVMNLNELEDLINGINNEIKDGKKNARLTRSDFCILRQVYEARLQNRFDYGEFMELKTEIKEEWNPTIEMNPIMNSPRADIKTEREDDYPNY